MKRTLIGIVLATAFIGAGWSIGKAQSKVADFEIAVDWPPGTVVLTCNRGCDWELNLKKDAHDFSEGGTIPMTAGPNKFSAGCEGRSRCGAVVNGKGFVRGLSFPVQER